MNPYSRRNSARTIRQAGKSNSNPTDRTSRSFTRRTKIRFVGRLTNERTAPLGYNSFETVRNEHLMVQNGRTQRFDTTGGGWVEADRLLADKYSPVVKERVFRDYGRPDPVEVWKYLYEWSIFSEKPIKLGDGEMQQRITRVLGYPFSGITRKGELRWEEPNEMESAI